MIQLRNPQNKLYEIPVNSLNRPYFLIIGPNKDRKQFSKAIETEEEFKKFLETEQGKEFKMIKSRNEFPKYDINGYYGCEDYVFDKINIPQYTYRENPNKLNDLITQNFPEIKLVTTPKVNDIVAFCEIDIPKHWGIISSLEEGIRVQSKLGRLDVIEQNIETFPDFYGNRIYFFRKI